MTETVKKQSKHSNKYEFTRANYAPLIRRKFIDINPSRSEGLEDGAVNDFRALGEDNAAEALYRIVKNSDNYNIIVDDMLIVFDAFAGLIEPTIDRKGGKDCKYLDWVCKSWIKDPVLVEDLYKIKDRLAYFEKLSGKLNKDDQKNQINQFKDFKELENVMRPYEQERAARAAKRQERKMSPEDKQRLKEESTIVYDGEEGKVVIPHTMWASQYWGNQTKWCISAAKEEENAFEQYNKSNPVFVYLPKPGIEDFELSGEEYSSFKFAAVAGDIYDERDKRSHKALPPCLNKLAVAAQKNLLGVQQDYLAKHGSLQRITDMPIGSVSGKDPLENNEADFSQYPEEWIGWLRAIEIDSMIFRGIPKELKTDKDFMLAAVKQNVSVLSWGILSDDLEKFCNDKEFMIDVVKQNSLGLKYASEDLQNDKDIVLAAVKQNGYALELASRGLRNNKDVVLEAVKENGRALEYASEDLRNDKEVVLEAVKENWRALQLVPEEFCHDKEIMLLTVRQDNNVRRLMPAKSQIILQNIKDFSSYLLEASGLSFEKVHLTESFNCDYSQNIAYDILKRGYGLSLNLVPEELLSNPKYIYKALQIAHEHGNAEPMLDDLRHVEALWGDFGAITNVDDALKKLNALSQPSLRIKKETPAI